jgi:hypothetical protein
MKDESVTEMEAHLRMKHDNLFAERNILVAVLSKIFPSVIAYHSPDEQGDDGGNLTSEYVVYLRLPTGQVSFHVGADARQSWFEHLQLATVPVWDGHTTDMKWDRVVAYLNTEMT